MPITPRLVCSRTIFVVSRFLLESVLCRTGSSKARSVNLFSQPRLQNYHLRGGQVHKRSSLIGCRSRTDLLHGGVHAFDDAAKHRVPVAITSGIVEEGIVDDVDEELS